MKHLIKLKILSFKNYLVNLTLFDKIKLLCGLFVGTIFLGFLYLMFYRVLIYIQSLQIIGPLLIYKFLAIVFITIFVMVIFSSIINAFSTIFFSDDLNFLLLTPIKLYKIFLIKTFETLIQSSWMIILSAIPFFVAFASVRNVSFNFFIVLSVLIIPFLFIATSIGVLFCLMLMYLFPSCKTRDIILSVIVIVGSVFYVIVRIIEPEKLSDPDVFLSTMEYLAYLNMPVATYLPSWWLTDSINSILVKDYGLFFKNLLLLFGISFICFILIIFLSDKLFYSGWINTQINIRKKKTLKFDFLKCRIFNKEIGSLLYKDIITLFRDNKQWTHILFVIALIIVYIFSVYKLPLSLKSGIGFDLQYLSDFIGFLNISGTGFILSALSLRFVFPQISLERQNLWFLLSIPVKIKKIFYEKFFISWSVIFLLGMILIFITNKFLNVSRVFFCFSIISMIFISTVITSLALGSGCIYPKLRVENIAQIETSWGGIVYAVCVFVYIGIITAIEAGPVNMLIKYNTGIIKSFDYFSFTIFIIEFFLINITVIFYSVYYGIKSLKNFEFMEW